MENTEQLKGFEVFEIKPQIVAKVKKTTELVRSVGVVGGGVSGGVKSRVE